MYCNLDETGTKFFFFFFTKHSTVSMLSLRLIFKWLDDKVSVWQTNGQSFIFIFYFVRGFGF